MLFLEFGQPQPLRQSETHPRGEYGLWCDQIEWRVDRRDDIVAGSEDDRATMEIGIQEIDGKTLISAELLISGDSIFKFSDDLVLRTFVITSEEDARWNYRDREGKYFRLGPDRAYPETQSLSQSNGESR